LALGLDEARARATIRFGLGRFNTKADVDRVARGVAQLITRLREPTPVFELGDEDDDLPSGWRGLGDV
ncbi:MAG: IscS subfamily cysteine desulfurase, partial [Acidobacteriota bacterium]|nr:IscS subfamily cysteine desulfurase [Acidobacteriota bacterium]